MGARLNPYLEAPRAVTLDRQIRAVEREIDQRRESYPRRVDDQRMSQQFADEEISVMEAVRDTLKGLRG